MKIYTKTGDSGSTGLVGGERISKTSPRISAIGEVDELNAALGVAISASSDPELLALGRSIQNRLFDLGSELATPDVERYGLPKISDDDVFELESSIDSQTASLPPLRQFILPGGTSTSAFLHLARCVCRRAERAVLTLNEEEPVRSEITRYLNRLSDWLFVAARTSNALSNVPDVAWMKKEQSQN